MSLLIWSVGCSKALASPGMQPQEATMWISTFFQASRGKQGKLAISSRNHPNTGEHRTLHDDKGEKTDQPASNRWNQMALKGQILGQRANDP